VFQLLGAGQDTSQSIFDFIKNHFCFNPDLKSNEANKHLLDKLLKELSGNGIKFDTFNNVLHEMENSVITYGFFQFLFQADQVDTETLKSGTKLLKGYSMLKHGNFRFGFKNLSKMTFKNILEELDSYLEIEQHEFLKNRVTLPNDFEEIDEKNTWLTGYLTSKQLERDKKIINEISELETIDEEMERAFLWYDEFEKVHEKVLKIAQKNTSVYLNQENMDIYIATLTCPQ